MAIAVFPDLGHHERHVEEAIDRVVSDQQRAIGGEVLDAVELRLDYAGPVLLVLRALASVLARASDVRITDKFPSRPGPAVMLCPLAFHGWGR
jgi:hypothetical protein